MREMFKPVIVAACAGAAVLAMSPVGSPFGPQAAFAQEAVAERPRQISVTGQGQVDVAPDMAVVRIGVTHQSEVAAEALQQTSDALARMLERLTGLGIEARDVQTANLSLNPVWRDSSDGRRQPEPWGFEASNVVSLRLRDLAQVGAVLDALVSDGANRLEGISFALQEPQAVQDEARRLAVADAQRKAALYAEAAGVTLGPVLSLSEGHDAAPRPMMMDMAMRAEAVPVAAGEVGLRASVQMVFGVE